MNKYFVFAVCLFAMLVMPGCKPLKIENMAFTVIRDMTDSNMTYPKTEEIVPIFGLDENEWRGVDLRLTFIADVEYGVAHNVQLPGRAPLLSNELERINEVRDFTIEVA